MWSVSSLSERARMGGRFRILPLDIFKMVMILTALSSHCSFLGCGSVDAFSVISVSTTKRRATADNIPASFSRYTTFRMSTDEMHHGDADNGDTHVPMSDDELLKTVPKSQFQDLCQQLDLSTKGTKMDLLLRLRKHADEQAGLEEKRRKDRKIRVEEGANADEREKHEIIEDEPYFVPSAEEDDDEEEGYFYFELPTTLDDDSRNNKQQNTTAGRAKPTAKNAPLTQADVLASPPPPPDAPVNENGERVVTVYSTTDHNDLTGVAAAQPGQAALSGTDPMAAGSSSPHQGSQPWDMDHSEQNNKVATSKELVQAKEKVTELVQMLLAMTGAPAFRHFDMPDELEDIMEDEEHNGLDYTASSVSSGYTASNGQKTATIGFDPSKVPAHLLTEASQSLRANRGQVLQEVLREFDLHAVGQDGKAGDKVEDGGGHFKEVAKVRAFLEGFRRAEVRKASRMTVTFLLDKLVSEGVEGLDLGLATMTRSNDDSASEVDAYELNDSLISYLNDIIREQEKKVERLMSSKEERVSSKTTDAVVDDPVNQLWNQTTGDDGEAIESIDPKDPKVQRVLKNELQKAKADQASKADSLLGQKESLPETAPEKMLLLLTLLRERVKTEAAFANDERSRNLRLLAYCLKCSSEADQEELIMKDLGSSIDKLDSFLELVASSIEYAESTSHQLQPAKRMPLNVKVLKNILHLTETIREQRAWKASGLRP